MVVQPKVLVETFVKAFKRGLVICLPDPLCSGKSSMWRVCLNFRKRKLIRLMSSLGDILVVPFCYLAIGT
jgi:hypothetical protein